MVEMRNIVLITFDSLRADHCSFMGYHRKTTPTLDGIARRGLYFENAIAAGTGTPSAMFGMFTGEFSPISPCIVKPNLWKKKLSKMTTLAEILSKLGYTTGAFNPNAFVSSFFGFNKGFNYYNDFLSAKNNNIYIFNKFFSENEQMSSIARNIRNLLLKKEIFMPWEKFYSQILDWIENAKESFFLWILLLDTHHPYMVSRKFRRYSNLFGMLYSNWKLYKVHWRDELSERVRKWLIDSYDDSIYYANTFLKNFLKDTRDINPIIIIHSDHGEAFGEHNFYGHQPYLYEEIIHVPLVIYNADRRGRVEKPVSLVDFLPTVLDLVGLKNSYVVSRSFLTNEKEWVITETLEFNRRKIAVRMRNWKFITGQKDGDELYNLKKDPYEQENVIDEYPDLTRELKKIVELYIRSQKEKEIIRKGVRALKV